MIIKKKKKTITNAVEVVMGTQLCEAHLVVISFLLRSHSNELRKFDHQIEDCGLANCNTRADSISLVQEINVEMQLTGIRV